jgi:hypothetical protein
VLLPPLAAAPLVAGPRRVYPLDIMYPLLINTGIQFLSSNRNHSVYDYIHQFNILAQYGSYQVDMDEKKASVFRNGLTVQLQGHLHMFPNQLYNELASVAINSEGSMKACAKAEEKKRKRIIPGSSSNGGSSGALPKYRIVYTLPSG